MVYNGEGINSLAAQHWQRFAKQPYFDPKGIFYSAIISAPLVLLMFIILVGGAKESSSGSSSNSKAPACPALPGSSGPAGRSPGLAPPQPLGCRCCRRADRQQRQPRCAARAAPLTLALPCPLQINYLLTASNMMVQAKRRELMMRAKARAKAEQEAKKDK